MWVISENQRAVEIDDGVVRGVLSLYPEEQLLLRKNIATAFNSGEIHFTVLRQEAAKMLVPWQMFFLEPPKLKQQIDNLEKNRAGRLSERLLAKRAGSGAVTSRRIIDRLIRLQDFVSRNVGTQKNPFIGALKVMSPVEAADHIVKYFEINRNYLWALKGKATARDYFVLKVQGKGINVSQGVLTNGILPHSKVVPGSVYKNTSGFAIYDERVPFLFLPNELNPDEVESRQIFSLVYLLVIVGLGAFDHFLDKKFSFKKRPTDTTLRKIYEITMEVLLPRSEASLLRGKVNSVDDRHKYSDRYKVSPTALITILFKRRTISREVYEALLPDEYVPGAPRTIRPRRQKLSNSVKKFAGTIAFDVVNSAVRAKTLNPVPAQHLLFGSANKKSFYKYRQEIGL